MFWASSSADLNANGFSRRTGKLSSLSASSGSRWGHLGRENRPSLLPSAAFSRSVRAEGMLLSLRLLEGRDGMDENTLCLSLLGLEREAGTGGRISLSQLLESADPQI